MKVIIICNKFPSEIDGVGDYTFHLSSSLVKFHQTEVYIICRNNEKILELEGVLVFPIISNWDFKNLKKTLKLINKIKPDWLILQYVPYAFNNIGLPWQLALFLFYFRIFKKPRIATFFHEVRIKINLYKFKSLALGIPMWLISGFVHLLSHESITSNKGYARLLSNYGKTASIIPVGCNVDILSVRSKEELKNKYGIKNEIVLGVFGFSIRSWETLFLTLRMLVDENYSIKLLAIGEYSLKFKTKIQSFLRQLNLEKQVILTGFVAADEVFDHLKLIDIYLMLEPIKSPDTWTGTSTRSGTLAAAMAAGCSIIGTKGELNDDELSSVVYLIDELSPLSLSNIIAKLVSDNAKCAELKDKAYLFFQHNLLWEKISNKYAKILIQN